MSTSINTKGKIDIFLEIFICCWLIVHLLTFNDYFGFLSIMNILYCSTVCSQKILAQLSNSLGVAMSSITIQKFHRLLLNGLVRNSIEVSTASVIPVSGEIDGSKYIKLYKDQEDGITYNYLTTFNIPILRHIFIVINTIRCMLEWHKENKNNTHVIICDVLNISVCIGALFGSFFNIKVVGIMTDMPGLMKGAKQNLLGKIIKAINLYILKKFDAYIFLTEAMNNVINKKHRPYIVMEGLVDVNMQMADREPETDVRNIIYAGGCYEEYGVKTLIEAVRSLPLKDIKLTIYGRGPMVKDMPKYEALDSRFHYKGIRPNNEVVQEELKAWLLVNPRPTHEEFTKYSFPSKNMEYMVSGTPLLTTALPGMPVEYYDKVFICYNETVEGFASALNDILSKSTEQLNEIGIRAKNFVLKEKNNIIQARRIITLISSI